MVVFAGHVSDLKDTFVSHVSLGKAHAVVLSNKGHVFTFGINNKGQCGREYVPGGARERESFYLSFNKGAYQRRGRGAIHP